MRVRDPILLAGDKPGWWKAWVKRVWFYIMLAAVLAGWLAYEIMESNVGYL